MIRATTFVAFLALAQSVLSFDTNKHPREYYEEKFVDFLAKFDIKAKNGGHFIEMLKKFANNVDFIESHNRSPAGQRYKLGINQFAHMTFEEWGQHMRFGLAPAHEPAPLTHQAVNGTSLSGSIDWTTKGAVTPVKDQGSCGSCWSFSATGAMEGAYQIKYGTLESFSEQNLVSCDTIDAGCNGGLMDNAFKWTKSNGGICTEDGYPYTSGTTKVDGTCNQSSCTKNTKVAPASYTDVKKNSDADFKSALDQQPVSVAIQANQPAFQFYTSGVMDGSCGAHLDHGVLAVGYGTDGGDYYKIKNSWGASWGESGYIRLAGGESYNRGKGQCGVLSGPPSYPNL
jgi:cathepsin L